VSRATTRPATRPLRARRRTGQIGVVVSDLANPFYPEVLRVLHAVLRSARRTMILFTEDEVVAGHLLDGSIDGVVLTTTRVDGMLPAELAAHGLPVVQLNREGASGLVDACIADNHGGGQLIADRLAALGHERIAAIHGPQDTSTGRDRTAGLLAGLVANGIDLPDERSRQVEFDFAAGRAATRDLLRERPTAIACANDVIALGALDALRSAGMRVPGDVSVIGFDDIAMAGWAAFGLTTVSQGIGPMAQRAAALLLERVDDPAGAPGRARRVVLPVSMILRETDAPPAG
jgi:LacI family transcriptional regulator